MQQLVFLLRVFRHVKTMCILSIQDITCISRNYRNLSTKLMIMRGLQDDRLELFHKSVRDNIDFD